MTVSAHDVAAAIRDRLPGIGTMKLHKLLYYCQGYHLAHTGEPLFREPLSAWDNGPVCAPLWRAERGQEGKPAAGSLDNDGLGTIGYVVSRYGALSGTELGRLTHQEEPWIRADEQRKRRPQSDQISRDSLREWFTNADQCDEEDRLDMDAVRAWLTQVAAEPAPARGEPATREGLVAWATRGV
jgi:uncharacterized phage-associated protein